MSAAAAPSGPQAAPAAGVEGGAGGGGGGIEERSGWPALWAAGAGAGAMYGSKSANVCGGAAAIRTLSSHAGKSSVTGAASVL